MNNSEGGDECFGGLSLVELYEERQWQMGWFHRELTNCRPVFASAHQSAATRLERMIGERIAAQPFGPWELENPRLLHGVPDAERVYKVRRYPPDTAFPWGPQFAETAGGEL